MHVRLVHLRSARAKYAVIMRIPSDMLPRHAVYFSDGPYAATTRGLHEAKVRRVGTCENSQPAHSESSSKLDFLGLRDVLAMFSS